LDALVELYGGTIYAPLPGLSSLERGKMVKKSTQGYV